MNWPALPLAAIARVPRYGPPTARCGRKAGSVEVLGTATTLASWIDQSVIYFKIKNKYNSC